MIRMSLKTEDFSKICRMCLLFKTEMLTLHVPEVIKMIQLCVDVQVSINDGFPQHICIECFGQINNYSAFRLLCKNSDEILHKIITDLNTSIMPGHSNDKHPTKDVQGTGVASVFIKTEDKLDIKKLNTHYSDNTTGNGNSEYDLLIKEDFRNVSDDVESFQEQDQSDNKGEPLVTDETNKKKTKNCISNSKNEEESEAVHCVICGKNISTSTFNNISYRHNLKNKFKCDECTISFKTRSRNKRNKPLECRYCSKTFCSKYQLDLHFKSHTKTTHACDICNREFKTNAKLKRHKTFVHGKGDFLCVTCHKLFSFDKHLQEHIKRCHDPESRAKQKTMCPMCGKEYMYLRTHMKQIHNNERHKCDQCTKEFALNSLLLKHVREKHGDTKKEPEALCPICGKVCVTRGQLKIHLIHHDENRNFNCHLCDKTYKTKSGLRHHLMVHKEIRPHSCTTCSKKFFSKTQLKRHQVVHTGERPYGCHICGRKFNQSAARKTHMKVHGF